MFMIVFYVYFLFLVHFAQKPEMTVKNSTAFIIGLFSNASILIFIIAETTSFVTETPHA